MLKRIIKNNHENFFRNYVYKKNIFKYFAKLFKQKQLHKHTHKRTPINEYKKFLIQNWCWNSF